MNTTLRMIIFLLLVIAPSAFAAGGKQSTVSITEDFTAQQAYDTGFAGTVMRDPGGVRLYDMLLVQDDAPGSGNSEKGPFIQPVFGDGRIRKDLWLDDPRANGAWVVFLTQKTGKYPLTVVVNGQKTSYDPASCTNGMEGRWVSFDPSWLKKGLNTILLSCPEATMKDRWGIMFSRGDEFTRGGGDSLQAGRNSQVSLDGGKSWKRGVLGPEGNAGGEFCVRLSLDRHSPEGWLASPVIDLWRSSRDGFIVPMSTVGKVRNEPASTGGMALRATCRSRTS